MDILFSSLAAGILFGMALSLVALGLTIIFGVMDIVNFAHGEFLMIGMYTGLLTAQALGIDPLLTLPVAAAVGFLLGIALLPGVYQISAARSDDRPAPGDLRADAFSAQPGPADLRSQ